MRAPFSRPRPPRAPLLTPKTVGISLALHAVLAAAGWTAYRAQPHWRTVVSAPVPGGTGDESVSYLDLGAWGEMATPGALPPAGDPAQAAPGAVVEGMTAASVDSVLSRLPAAVPFPQRVPRAIPGAAQGGAGGFPQTVPGAGGGVPGGQAGGTQPGGGAGRGRGGMGRLGPEYGDPRLVVTPQVVPERQMSDEERYQRHFEARINAVNDSILGEAEHQRRLTDWTVRDSQGRRWGIDQNGPVVAGKNVPLPVPVPIPRSARDREDEARTQARQRTEIQRQADETERARYLRDRARAVREREERRREQEKQKEEEESESTP